MVVVDDDVNVDSGVCPYPYPVMCKSLIKVRNTPTTNAHKLTHTRAYTRAAIRLITVRIRATHTLSAHTKHNAHTRTAPIHSHQLSNEQTSSHFVHVRCLLCTHRAHAHAATVAAQPLAQPSRLNTHTHIHTPTHMGRVRLPIRVKARRRRTENNNIFFSHLQ